MLRGNHPARIDDKGRLKMPNGFRAFVEQQWGAELFVTSLSGDHVWIYPMAVWLEIERKLAGVPSTSPAKLRFLNRVNFYGQAVAMDRQGRVVLPQLLRGSAAMAADARRSWGRSTRPWRSMVTACPKKLTRLRKRSLAGLVEGTPASLRSISSQTAMG